MTCRDCCRSCCTCERSVQGISRFFTYVAFLFTILSLSVAGWSAKCQACVAPSMPEVNGVEFCHYLGLFEWCEASGGRELCEDFNPRTVDKSVLSRGSYLASQAFMVMSAILSAFYVVVDIANWFVRATQDPARVTVIKYTEDAWFFYIVTIFQGIFALVAQAIWAQQKNTHEHFSHYCGKIYFDFGPSFALAALVWIICALNIIWRTIFRRYFVDTALPPPSHQVFNDEREPQSGEFHGVGGGDYTKT